jgi:hypothetical protein
MTVKICYIMHINDYLIAGLERKNQLVPIAKSIVTNRFIAKK